MISVYMSEHLSFFPIIRLFLHRTSKQEKQLKKNLSIVEQGTKIFIILFAIGWIAFFMTDYMNKHQLLTRSVMNFSYLYLSLSYLVIGALFVWLLGRPNPPSWLFSPIVGYGLGIMLIFITYQFFYHQVVAGFGYENNLLRPYMIIIGYSLPLIFTLITTRVLGILIMKLIPIDWEESDYLVVSFSLGISGFIFLLFLLGFFGILSQLNLLIAMLVVLAIGYKHTLHSFKSIYSGNPALFKGFNWLGYASLYLILLFAFINMARIISPMPVGNDAQNFYINIARLIYDYGDLPEGFQPFNWSLFISTGYFLSGKTQGALPFSYIAGLLSMLAIYRLGRNLFQINSNVLMLACLVFYFTPTVFNQSIAELKIDLGLLFISLSIVLLIFKWVRLFQEEGDEPNINQQWKIHLSYALLIGILLGVALGIKLTTFFLLFSVLAVLWYYGFGWQGFFYFSLFSLGVAFFGKLDTIIGIRSSHYYVEAVQWLLLLAGLFGMAYFFIKFRKKFIQLTWVSVIIVFSSIIVFSPWMVKNYRDYPESDFMKLVQGTLPSDLVRIKAFEKRQKMVKEIREKKENPNKKKKKENLKKKNDK